MSEKLTVGRIKQLIEDRPTDKPYRITYDAQVPGLGVRITRTGFAAFILNYRTRTGTERRYTIGDAADFSITQARKRARDLRQRIAEDGDPLQELREQRVAKTLAEVVDSYLVDEMPRLAPSTAEEYRAILRRYILPEFGSRKFDDIIRDDVERLHRTVSRRAPIRANRCSAVLAAVFAYGGRRPEQNPARAIRRNRESKRTRFLSTDELARLMSVLEQYRVRGPVAADAADAITLLLLTGSRRMEVLGARWAEFVDLDGASPIWVKPEHRTKTREQHVVPLGTATVELLQRRQKAGGPVVALRRSEYVFAGRGTPSHELALHRAWARIRSMAQINDVRVHDLRHAHASLLVAAGYSLPQIGKLLGHAQPSTTARYAHLEIEGLRGAVNQVAALVSKAGNDR